MSIKKEEDIAVWLCDAYTSKIKTIAILEKQLKEGSGYSYYQNNIKEHLKETKHHAELFLQCLSKYRHPIVSTKNNLIKVNTKRLKKSKLYKSDKAFVRDVYSSYTPKEDSVLSYQAIKEAAEGLGDRETVSICDIILQDEKKIEDWRLAVSVVAKES